MEKLAKHFNTDFKENNFIDFCDKMHKFTGQYIVVDLSKMTEEINPIEIKKTHII